MDIKYVVVCGASANRNKAMENLEEVVMSHTSREDFGELVGGVTVVLFAESWHMFQALYLLTNLGE